MDDELKIDPEFKARIPKATDGERELLKGKLVAEGCQEKLVAWENDPDNIGGLTLIEGHTRHAICEELGIGYSLRRMKFSGRDEVLVWILENQFGRRNLSDDQRAALAFDLVELQTQIETKSRAVKAGQAGGVGRPKENSLEAQTAPKLFEKPVSVQKTRVRETVAKEAKVSEKKIRGVAEVEKKSPGMAHKIAAGEVTIREARKEVKAKEEAEAKFAPDPDAPPWAEFNAKLDEFISELHSTALRLGKALGYDAKTKRLAHKHAHFFTHLGTVGAINAVARTLADNRPAAKDDKPPGYLPTRVMEARQAVCVEGK